jgi:enoyl-CoA hydratase
VKNAIDARTADALLAAFTAFDVDPDARVAILWGEGGTFCAGADLKSIGRGDGPRIEIPANGPAATQPGPAHVPGPLGPTRLALGKPVIAAVAGHAVAGGLELAIWCDLRVAEETAFFGVFCRRWGVPLIDGGTVRLPRLIGHGRALDMILTGRAVGAREALAMGLCDRVVPEGHVRAEAERLAHVIAAHPQTCMRNDRRSAYDAWGLTEEEAMKKEFAHGTATLVASDVVAGANAFLARQEARKDKKAPA